MMKTAAAVAIVALGVAFTAGCGSGGGDNDDGGIMKTGKAKVLLFTSPEVPASAEAQAVVKKVVDQVNKDLGANIRLETVDMTVDYSDAVKHDVTGAPTTIVSDSDGLEVFRFTTVPDTTKLKSILNDAVNESD